MWKKGESGNPLGRPKNQFSLTTALREYTNTKDAKGITIRDGLVQKLTELALSGDMKALAYIFDRQDGKPFQAIATFTGDESLIPEALRVVFDDSEVSEES